MLNAEGVPVDGSDRERSAKTDRLESLGITVEFGQRAENVASASTVVYSSAIKPSNPEIVAANEVGLHIVHRSDILALLMNGKRAVTVAGAHGKTTTSSMLAHILVHTGADPSYAIGHDGILIDKSIVRDYLELTGGILNGSITGKYEEVGFKIGRAHV